ncbi:shikimate dehydrogenase [Microbacterium sp. SD291]|uniref:shikimate dehydrogenase n=1 Tax=Microbacterium sp. SD291 TaxID=2782007 RepID=UPI001A970551|nr:shikimate dehydrogenase [Microbacterium sp. SD291]MBO0979067.1 shikimate dehydrogenase [Microbacterium sp. SD291]
MSRDRLAVWGDPIAHSRSPQLHAAAYDVLGLDWDYGRRQVTEAGFAEAFASLDESWRGLSLTMPLKEEAHRVADVRDRHAELTGVANTLLLGERVLAFNTDVGGIVDALAEHGITRVDTVRVLGGGATAASALVAVADLGAAQIDVRVRRPEGAAPLAELGGRLGVRVEIGTLSAESDAVDLTVATLPGGSALPDEVSAPLAAHGGALFDVAYSPWPSALASIWGDAPAISGLGMLLHQAVRQIRVFRHGDPEVSLPDEATVIAAMRAALQSQDETRA